MERHSFIGAGTVVNKDVQDHALNVGNPSRQIGWVCECGESLTNEIKCLVCGRSYRECDSGIKEKYLAEARK